MSKWGHPWTRMESRPGQVHYKRDRDFNDIRMSSDGTCSLCKKEFCVCQNHDGLGMMCTQHPHRICVCSDEYQFEARAKVDLNDIKCPVLRRTVVGERRKLIQHFCADIMSPQKLSTFLSQHLLYDMEGKPYDTEEMDFDLQELLEKKERNLSENKPGLIFSVNCNRGKAYTQEDMLFLIHAGGREATENVNKTTQALNSLGSRLNVQHAPSTNTPMDTSSTLPSLTMALPLPQSLSSSSSSSTSVINQTIERSDQDFSPIIMKPSSGRSAPTPPTPTTTITPFTLTLPKLLAPSMPTLTPVTLMKRPFPQPRPITAIPVIQLASPPPTPTPSQPAPPSTLVNDLFNTRQPSPAHNE